MNKAYNQDSMPLVVAIVLHYNHCDMTLRCIESLMSQTYSNMEILVVDNQSLDNSYKFLRDKFDDVSKVKVIQNSTNAGYAGGNNFAARWRIEKGPFNYLLVANNDIEVIENDVVEKLVQFAESKPDLGGLQPRVMLENGTLQGPYLRPSIYIDTMQCLMPPFWFFRRKLRQKQIRKMNVPGPCFRVIGAFFMVRAKDFFDVGLFDENTFLYREEDILALKLLSRGLRFYYYPQASVVHHHDHNGWHGFAQRALQFNAFLSSERYFFGEILGNGRFMLEINCMARRLYYKVMHPLRSLLNLD